jgi:hypothetical protein
MPKRKQTGPDPLPVGYAPEPGDEWIRVIELRREHQGRVFEARGPDGAGVRGPLIDVQWHLLHGLIMLQFRDVDKWVRSGIEGWLLMKPEGWVDPDLPTPEDV